MPPSPYLLLAAAGILVITVAAYVKTKRGEDTRVVMAVGVLMILAALVLPMFPGSTSSRPPSMRARVEEKKAGALGAPCAAASDCMPGFVCCNVDQKTQTLACMGERECRTITEATQPGTQK